MRLLSPLSPQRAATLCLLALSIAILAAATLVVDQRQPVIDSNQSLAIGGPSEEKLAQVITAGASGRLAEIWLPVGCASGQLDLEIQGVDGSGLPDGNVLHRMPVPAATLPSVLPAVFQQFRLARRLHFDAGDRFAVVLINETGSCGISPGPAGDSYAGGKAYFDARPNQPGWIELFLSGETDPRDLSFQTVVLIR